jgi:hypothetical protein
MGPLTRFDSIVLGERDLDEGHLVREYLDTSLGWGWVVVESFDVTGLSSEKSFLLI